MAVKMTLRDLTEFAALRRHGTRLLRKARRTYRDPRRSGVFQLLNQLDGVLEELTLIDATLAADAQVPIPASDMPQSLKDPREALDVGIRYVERASSYLGGWYAKAQGSGGTTAPPVNAYVSDDVIAAHSRLAALEERLGEIQGSLDLIEAENR